MGGRQERTRVTHRKVWAEYRCNSGDKESKKKARENDSGTCCVAMRCKVCVRVFVVCSLAVPFVSLFTCFLFCWGRGRGVASPFVSSTRCAARKRKEIRSHEREARNQTISKEKKKNLRTRTHGEERTRGQKEEGIAGEGIRGWSSFLKNGR